MSLQSISYTDWLNSVLTSDSLGEVILAVLPQICYTPQYIKRTLERRFVSIQQRSISFPMLMLISFMTLAANTGNVTTEILPLSCHGKG